MLLRRRKRLRFRGDTWAEMLAELRERGGGYRESGAFILANLSRPRTVQKVVYLDDLDPDCLNGAISLPGAAYGALWELCDREGLRVVADVHTHPGEGVQQSPTDRANPMIAASGHLALIVPRFATGRVRRDELGVHEYLGDGRWCSAYRRRARRLIYVGRFA
jgi:hypothetical protein